MTDMPPAKRGTAATIRDYWNRHDGLDGVVRVGGAIAVVVTIEALAGYFLWRGTTESVQIPPTLGWSLQFGLTGGSVVGTRAFHRGHSEDQWWGLATSLVAVLFVVADASMAALLLNNLVHINAGVLAVGVLVECLVIGYLTVHTLMAAPRAGRSRATETTLQIEPAPEWGPPDTVTDTVTTAAPCVEAESPNEARAVEAESVTAPLALRSVTGKRTRPELVTAGAALTPPIRRRADEKLDEFRRRVERGERAARRDRQPVSA